ncbi:MAG: hypothetical protein J6Z82_01455, partial [Schwartzia sp.]|nr:hypothetical protein [Schwartzia sp. (in: firmicutes)]
RNPRGLSRLFRPRPAGRGYFGLIGKRGQSPAFGRERGGTCETCCSFGVDVRANMRRAKEVLGIDEGPVG